MRRGRGVYHNVQGAGHCRQDGVRSRFLMFVFRIRSAAAIDFGDRQIPPASGKKIPCESVLVC